MTHKLTGVQAHVIWKMSKPGYYLYSSFYDTKNIYDAGGMHAGYCAGKTFKKLVSLGILIKKDDKDQFERYWVINPSYAMQHK